MGRVYRAEKEPSILLGQLSAIRALADGEKEALGFLPEAAYREAVERRRLVAMYCSEDGNTEVAGFILYSGVFRMLAFSRWWWVNSTGEQASRRR
jgi:hypothetical protein